MAAVSGQGKPLFPATDATIDLELTESRSFRNGVTMLRYRRDVTQLAEVPPIP